jgi:thiamine biosynthesis lipoprotein ApbE
VLAANTTTSGALATIAMLKGEHALDWLNTQDVHYLAVQHDGLLLRSAAAHSLKASP